MSELQDDPHLIQRQRQQRQILAMMGIQHWVRPDSPTQSIADIFPLAESDLISNPTVISSMTAMTEISGTNSRTDEQNNASADSPVSIVDGVADSQSYTIETPHLTPNSLNNTPTDSASNSDAVSDKIYHFDTTTDSAVAQSAMSIPDSADLSDSREFLTNQESVSPFDLQGGCFGNWVLVVNIKSLTHDTQKLWQNMVQALSLSCENTSFPHCSGMDSVELANASLSGYLFKVGRREDIKVAALTPLPKGVTHPYLFSTPTLADMIADYHLKRKFWLQINDEQLS